MASPINSNISIVICSKDSYEDVFFHLRNADLYEVGEIIFVTSCDDEIKVISEYTEKCRTPINLVIDEGTGVGQARAKGLAAVTKAYLIFLGPDNRMDSSAISKIFNQLTSLNFRALAFSQKIFNPRKYFEKCQNYRFKNKFPAFIPRDVIGTPHIIKTEDARKIGYNVEVDCCDDTLFFNSFSKEIGPIACSDIAVEEISQDIIKRMIWYGKSDFQFLQTLQKKRVRNYFHSFLAETEYIFSEKNIFITLFCLPGLLLLAITRQYAFLKFCFRKA